MPQLPTNSTEDLGADDEVKEYKEEEDENSRNGTHVDLVNDIKTDLIKRDAESSEVSVCSLAQSIFTIGRTLGLLVRAGCLVVVFSWVSAGRNFPDVS